MALIRGEITIPTTLGGERVVCSFPVVGGQDSQSFIEAQVITVGHHGPDGCVQRFTVHRFAPTSAGGRVVHSSELYRSFPDAIRNARKQAGWG